MISRSTAFAYKGRSVTTREVGQQLGVQYVLEGSVMPSGETIRVNAQLIDAVSDMHLWAERFDKPRSDVLLVHNEIVGRLSRSVGLQIAKRDASRSQAMQHPEAIDLAMQGIALVNQRMTRDTAEQATALFRRALALEPAHVEAQVGLASVMVYQIVNFYRKDRDKPLDEAVQLLEAALTVDPSHLGALKTRGAVLRAQGSFMEAIRVDQAVIAQNPGEPTAYREIGLNNLYLGELEEAVSWFEGADRIAPRDPIRWTWLQGLGRALIGLGRDDEALKALQMAVESRPGVPEIYGLLAAAEALAGHAGRARERLDDYATREAGITIRGWSTRSHVPLQYVSQKYQAANQRLLDGLRLAGMAED